MILGLVHASNLCHTIHHETKDMSIMKIENHEQDINQVHHAQRSCASTMYVNRYHPWNVSTICQDVHLPICQDVHLPICQPCASTNYSNHVHLSICQTNTIYECTIMHHQLHQAIISTMHQQAMTPQ
jgi:hypothetical protein